MDRTGFLGLWLFLCTASKGYSLFIQRPALQPAAPFSKELPSSSALVLPAVGEGFKDGLTVEFLRFVTAYGRGFEALVDLTPYSALMSSVADVADAISFYSFIDTWVNNGTGQDMMYVNNKTGTCHKERISHGNGWLLDVDLLLWPLENNLKEVVDTRPYASVTIASGPNGGVYGIGAASVHEGRLTDPGSVTLEKSIALDHVSEGFVYDCTGQEEIRQAAEFGQMRMKITEAAMKNKSRRIDYLEENFYTYFASPYLQQVTIIETRQPEMIAKATYNARAVDLRPGMPVFLSPWDAFTDELYAGEFWTNSSYPLREVGTVKAVTQANSSCKTAETGNFCEGLAELHLPRVDQSCVPNTQQPRFPRFFVPSGPNSLDFARGLARSLRKAGEAAAAAKLNNRLEKPTSDNSPLLLRINGMALSRIAMHGTIDLKGPSAVISQDLKVSPLAHGAKSSALRKTDQALHASRSSQKEKRVCVVLQRRHGRFFEKRFSMPRLHASGDRVILQLVITGHGWETTTESCGEYCHAMYSLSINHKIALNITQWRADCRVNPLGEQHGTWKFARNGWCPGSVQPGLFVDVTRWMRKRENSVALDLHVQSKATGAYEPYTDRDGFVLRDVANLVTGATLFVYGKDAVQHIMAQPSPQSPAELAVREGSSDPLSVRSSLPQLQGKMNAADKSDWTFDETPDSLPMYLDRLLARKLRHNEPSLSYHTYGNDVHHMTLPNNEVTRLAKDNISNRYNFASNAPWHLLKEEHASLRSAKHISVMSGVLVQGSTRWNSASIPSKTLPHSWHSAALRLRLSAPPDGLEIDAWDRIGSVGLHVKETMSGSFRGPEQKRKRTRVRALHVVGS